MRLGTFMSRKQFEAILKALAITARQPPAFSDHFLQIDLVGSESWFRVVVPSDVFSSECQADAGSGLAIGRVRA